jgi:endonuclease-3
MKSTKKLSKQQKANEIRVQLNQMFPHAKIELNHKNLFELLIAVTLSAQTTDISVNKVTPQLFKTYQTIDQLALAKPEDVEKIIASIGLFRNKAKNIIHLSQKLINDYQGMVPKERKDLESLPGVGRKTANVILSQGFGIPAIAVDTHVMRVSIRLGLADKKDEPLTIEKKLMSLFDSKYWHQLHHQLIFFGRYHCLAKKPHCGQCPLYDMCLYAEKQLGVK